MNIKSILESLLLVNERPIETKELAGILNIDKRQIEKSLDELASEYSARASGVCIIKVAGGYQMCSHPDNEEWVKKMYQEKNKQRLSGASLETLAIIAYKQPITRTEVELIRGVNVDGVTRHLLEWGLIKEAGRYPKQQGSCLRGIRCNLSAKSLSRKYNIRFFRNLYHRGEFGTMVSCYFWGKNPAARIYG